MQRTGLLADRRSGGVRDWTRIGPGQYQNAQGKIRSGQAFNPGRQQAPAARPMAPQAQGPQRAQQQMQQLPGQMLGSMGGYGNSATSYANLASMPGYRGMPQMGQMASKSPTLGWGGKPLPRPFTQYQSQFGPGSSYSPEGYGYGRSLPNTGE